MILEIAYTFVYTMIHLFLSFHGKDPHDRRSFPPGEHAEDPDRSTEGQCSFRHHALRRASGSFGSREAAKKANHGGTGSGHCGGPKAVCPRRVVHDGGGASDARIAQVRYTEAARCALVSLPVPIAERILNKMAWYVRQEEPLHFAKHLKGKPSGATHRFRIGVYRVLVIPDGHSLVVLGISHRSEAYRL